MAGAPSELPFSTEPSVGSIQLAFLASTEAFFLPTFVTSDVPEMAELGGMSEADLLTLWKSVTDPAYHLPLLEKVDGGGEFIKAALAMHAFVSTKVDASLQSLYILHWSGQTSEPSHLARLATGFLQFTRVPQDIAPAWLPLVFEPDWFGVDHVGIDWSEDGPVEFLSGRRYFLTERAVLGPAELGPKLYPARAEKAGASYNLPGPGTIRRPYQAGIGLNNTALSVTNPSPATNWLVLAPAPDLVSHAQLGQYVLLSSPAGVAGQVRRVVSYLPPLDSTNGGTAVLDSLGVFAVGSVIGTWQLGEEVSQASSGAKGVLIADSNGHFAIEATLGVFTTGAIFGLFSGATASITAVVRACAIPPASSVAWTVLDWELDLGLEVTNLESFTGGRLPVLEELGAERNVFHASGEPEAVYRQRVATAADVVSPNAIQRAANRILAPYGGAVCLREVGYPKLRGLFFDVEPDGNPDHAFAFDMDGDLRLGDRWKVLLDNTEFRAFFLLGLPRFGLDEFGAYDDTDPGFDGAAYLDGYAVGEAALHAAVYSSVVRAKAGGVGFDLYIEADGCV